MAEAIFPIGIRAYKPNSNAPEYIIAELDIQRDDFLAWLHSQGERVKLTVKLSKTGAYYVQVNDFKVKEEVKELDSLFDKKIK